MTAKEFSEIKQQMIDKIVNASEGEYKLLTEMIELGARLMLYLNQNEIALIWKRKVEVGENEVAQMMWAPADRDRKVHEIVEEALLKALDQKIEKFFTEGQLKSEDEE